MEDRARLFVCSERAPRLDQFLALRCPDMSRSRLGRLVREGHVTVNGAAAKPAQALYPGDQVALQTPAPTPSPLAPEPIPLRVIHEDRDILVVDKSPGMPVHPSPGHPSHTLVNAILAHCTDLSGLGGALRPGIVHRLDKDTSGLMVVAKNDAAHRAVARQLQDRHVEKTYLALVWGLPQPTEGSIEAPIGRDPRNRKRMAVVGSGRDSLTFYQVKQRLGDVTLVEARPRTGRTHQIRVHLASIGHPVVGDPVYSRRKTDLVARQFLHSHRLRLRLPSTGQEVEFAAPLPADLVAALEAFSRLGTPLVGGTAGAAPSATRSLGT